MDVQGEADSLLRSLRMRVASIAGISEREEPRAVVFFHSGTELARVLVKPAAYPRLLLPGGEPQEIRGLPDCAAGAGKIQQLAAARSARIPQLDLFGKR